MRVVVTGGAGFVGSHIVEKLAANGHEVLVLDRALGYLPESDPRYPVDPWKQALPLPGVRWLAFDIADWVPGELGDHLRGTDAVVHAAAHADLRKNWDEKEGENQRESLFHDNLQATHKLLENMPQVPLVYLSSASVYGDHCEKSGHAAEEPAATSEGQLSPYSASKFACEALVAAYARGKGFPFWSLRLVNQVGKRYRYGVIADFVRMAKQDKYIKAADDGSQRKGWVHVEDTADVVVRILENQIPSGVYNVSSKERWSWRDVVAAMGYIHGDVGHENRRGGAIGDPIDIHVNTTKLDKYIKCERKVINGVRDALKGLGWTTPYD